MDGNTSYIQACFDIIWIRTCTHTLMNENVTLILSPYMIETASKQQKVVDYIVPL